MSDASSIALKNLTLYDLHSLYVACLEDVQASNIPWHARPRSLECLSTFDDFLSYEWSAITVTDVKTGQSHLATTDNALYIFGWKVGERYDCERLPPPRVMPNVITPFETPSRPKHMIKDVATYNAVCATLPALQLEAQISRAIKGELSVVRELWDTKEKTFLAIDFEWYERKPSMILEWGYAAVQCGSHGLPNALDGCWPPRPEDHYRRGHYIIEDYVDKVANKHCPTFPRDYAFGKSQCIYKIHLPRAIQELINSLASPDSETTSNRLVLVGHGVQGDLKRLKEMGIDVPRNVVIVDTASYERKLFVSGRGDPRATVTASGKPRAKGRTFSLPDMLRSHGIAIECKLHNAGNDAMMCLLVFQRLLELSTEIPRLRSTEGRLRELQDAVALLLQKYNIQT